MRIVIVGAGEVGQYLAGIMVAENHDLTIIDTNPDKIGYIAENFDVQAIEGSGTNAAVLESAETAQADLLLALTDKDEVNMLAAYFGKQLGARATVARIASDDVIEGHPAFYRKRLGVDLVISPARLAAAEATAVVQAGCGSGIAEFGFGRIHLRPFIVNEGSPYTKKPIRDQQLPGALIVAVVRDGEVLVPGGDDLLEADDRIFVICKPEAVQYVQKGVGESTDKVKSIFIIGGGNIGAHAAGYFDTHRYTVKLFEDDRRRAWQLADELRHVRVIDDDGTDLDVLKSEYFEHADAFITATGSDEKNLMTAVLARERGVARTVAVVDRPQFAELGKQLGLTATLAPRILVANQVLAFVRGGNVNRISLIAEGKAEVIELQAAEGSRLVGKSLMDVKLPRGIIIGGIIRGNKAVIPKGKDEIQLGDSVVIFAMASQLEYVENMLIGQQIKDLEPIQEPTA